jgi:hypothetical protein
MRLCGTGLFVVVAAVASVSLTTGSWRNAAATRAYRDRAAFWRSVEVGGIRLRDFNTLVGIRVVDVDTEAGPRAPLERGVRLVVVGAPADSAVLRTIGVWERFLAARPELAKRVSLSLVGLGAEQWPAPVLGWGESLGSLELFAVDDQELFTAAFGLRSHPTSVVLGRNDSACVVLGEPWSGVPGECGGLVLSDGVAPGDHTIVVLGQKPGHTTTIEGASLPEDGR